MNPRDAGADGASIDGAPIDGAPIEGAPVADELADDALADLRTELEQLATVPVGARVAHFEHANEVLAAELAVLDEV